jgi:hypothetical protein
MAAPLITSMEGLMRSLGLALALLVPAAANASGTLDAIDGAETQFNLMNDAKGPVACGYRSRFVAGDPMTAVTVGDVSMMLNWSEERQATFGSLKVRVERHTRGADGNFAQTGTARIERVQVSKADLSSILTPAAGPFESPDDAGYYIAPTTPEAMLNVMLPDAGEGDVTVVDDEVLLFRDLMLSFKDADRAAQETIRYRATLKGADSRALMGCVNQLIKRFPDTGDAPASP